MSAVAYIQPENRLGKLIARAGGISADKAVAAASANLETIREQSVAEVDREIARLGPLAARATGEAKARLELYGCANAVAGLAGACGLAKVGEAAFSLCELSDRFIAAGNWNPEAVGVHLHTIALLRGGGVGDAVEAALLKALADLLAWAPKGAEAGDAADA